MIENIDTAIPALKQLTKKKKISLISAFEEVHFKEGVGMNKSIG